MKHIYPNTPIYKIPETTHLVEIFNLKFLKVLSIFKEPETRRIYLERNFLLVAFLENRSFLQFIVIMGIASKKLSTDIHYSRVRTQDTTLVLIIGDIW